MLIRPLSFLPNSIFLSSLPQQWCSQFQDNTNAQGKTQIPIRLIVPASQCGSLIGKFSARSSHSCFFMFILATVTAKIEGPPASSRKSLKEVNFFR